MSATIEVEGLKPLVKALRQSGTGLNKQMRVVNLEVARDAAERIRPHAPRGKGSEGDKHPGALAASIRGTAAQVRGLIKIGGGKIAYASPVLFGWPKHHIRPHPFWQEPLDEGRESMIDKYAAGVVKALKEQGLEE